MFRNFNPNQSNPNHGKGQGLPAAFRHKGGGGDGGHQHRYPGNSAWSPPTNKGWMTPMATPLKLQESTTLEP